MREPAGPYWLLSALRDLAIIVFVVVYIVDHV